MTKLVLPPKKIPLIINRVLLIICAAIAVFLITGTIYAFARPSNAGPLFTMGNSRALQVSGANQADDIRVFSGLGRLRIPLSNSTTLILSITFPYSVNDIPFTEELAAKLGELKATASGYFSALPEEDLIQIDEDAAKQEILKRFNSNLRLGKITALYFSDMLVID